MAHKTHRTFYLHDAALAISLFGILLPQRLRFSAKLCPTLVCREFSSFLYVYLDSIVRHTTHWIVFVSVLLLLYIYVIVFVFTCICICDSLLYYTYITHIIYTNNRVNNLWLTPVLFISMYSWIILLEIGTLDQRINKCLIWKNIARGIQEFCIPTSSV